MKILKYLASLLLVAFASTAHSAVVFSTSELDPAAGSTLDLVVGDSGSMYVWMSTEVGQTYTGVGLDILSSNAATLEATAYEIFNPGSRWSLVDLFNAQLGDLATGWNAFTFSAPPGGLSTNGEFALFSRVDFQATDIGSTGLSFAVNFNGIGDLNGQVDPATVSFGTGTVNVSAIPEPSATLILLGAGLMGLRRRKR